jgi:hypothetical protein
MTDNESPNVEGAKVAGFLPYRGWWPFIAGALSGIVLRLIYSGNPGTAYAAMAASFIFFAPVVVGAVTIFVAERSRQRSWWYYAWAGAAANLLFVAGTMLVLIEGIICAVIILPLFAALGAIGGLLMGAICRAVPWRSHVLFGFTAVPLVLAAVGPVEAPIPSISIIEKSRTVDAAPEVIWKQLESARDIREPEVGRAWMYRIGVPLPLEGVTSTNGDKHVRQVRMGHGIHFEQVASEWVPNKRVRWTYKFSDDSFPPGSLDDHVRIGGEYFDLIETVYSISPAGDGMSRLSIEMKYRVSTQFNWYAKPIAKVLIENFCDVILDFYARRAERDIAA